MAVDETTAATVVREFFTAGYIDHDYDRVMDLVAQDYVDHSPAGARSNADAVGILRIVEGMFNDLQLTFEDVFADGAMVSTRIRYEGYQIGECCRVAPTGRRIAFEALENFRVIDGKIVESWGYWPEAQIVAMLTE
ncbi:snoaL polyketide cyclase [Bifidobacterium anseris]|uniref:SnoaL polyketide cyclase n=1 Tax=Bifidobacterium anseris TaxID=2020963 RepID=A0A2N5IX97_9BIFI|nr:MULTISPECIES: ester cyclase [Bifidobacterium]PLS26579.1 snoaL polyketide cyclase [Bifidobacterium anseris]